MCACKQGTCPGKCPCGCRHTPLVTIDPADREQVERLCKVLVESMHAAGDMASAAKGVHPATVTMALREFAKPTPPKPDEPMGLGAVVATERDGDYILVSLENDAPWYNVQSDSFTTWSAVRAVRVLSEGLSS